jgi:hypothetical protein
LCVLAEAAPHSRALDEIARLCWRAHGEGHIAEADAEALSESIEAFPPLGGLWAGAEAPGGPWPSLATLPVWPREKGVSLQPEPIPPSDLVAGALSRLEETALQPTRRLAPTGRAASAEIRSAATPMI